MSRSLSRCCLFALLVLLPDESRAGQLASRSVGTDSSAAKDRQAVQVLARVIERTITAAAEAMPADKYAFAPTEGEFHGVRTFGQQVKHLAATNYILAAAALGRNPPADAGDEVGPDTVRTKAEILAYLRGSFLALDTAIAAIGDPTWGVKSSPISPFQGGTVTRIGLVVESLLHATDHYGQIVEYLRMNRIVPPASRG